MLNLERIQFAAVRCGHLRGACGSAVAGAFDLKISERDAAPDARTVGPGVLQRRDFMIIERKSEVRPTPSTIIDSGKETKNRQTSRSMRLNGFVL